MQAVVFNATPTRYLAGRVLMACRPSLAWRGFPAMALREWPEPALPGPEWVKVRTRLGGVCGSDVQLAGLQVTPYASAFTALPFVVGHENVGDVVAVGPAVTRVRPGARVTVDPALGCLPRGAGDTCPACARGETNLCEQVDGGHLAPGLMVGACRDTGGSWGEYFVAHESQVYPVPDGVSDQEALLVEPAAVTAHAVLRRVPGPRERVLVIGGGIIGLLTVGALRALGCRAPITALVRHRHQGEHARRLGADTVVAARGEYLRDLAADTGARVKQPVLGRPVLLGGYEAVYACVGSARSVDDALRAARGGAHVTLLGCAGLLSGIDWTPVWLKELHVTGSYIYKEEERPGGRRHTFDVVLGLLGEGALPLHGLVTHTFGLHQYPQALAVAARKGNTGSIKVALKPGRQA